MIFFLDQPMALFAVSLAILWCGSRLGAFLRTLRSDQGSTDDTDFSIVLGAILTLLGLIIGFTFSMAVNRYDLRKNREEQEANAIGTEYVRAEILEGSEADKVRFLLRDYVDQRIAYYTTHDEERLRQIRLRTLELQSRLWAAIIPSARVQRDSVFALVVSGMNDVLNSEGYAEAAWRNRIPVAAWSLLMFTAAFCNILLGYHAHGKPSALLTVLPAALAIAFFLIAEIDSPRTGVIRVHAQNLESLANSLRSQ